MKPIKILLIAALCFVGIGTHAQPITYKTIDLNVRENITTHELETELYKGKRARFKGIPHKFKNKNSQLRYAVLDKDTLFVLYGDLNKKERICIVDNDMDFNFSNNFTYQIDKDKNELITTRPLAVSLSDKHTKNKQKVFVNPILISETTEKLSKKERKDMVYDINIGISLYNTGHVELNGTNYTLLIQNSLGNHDNYQYSLVKSNNFKPEHSHKYTLSEHNQGLEIDGFIIEPTFISQTRKNIDLKITDIYLLEKSKQIGIEEGYTIPDLITSDLNNRTISLANYRGEYLLIDFWGTWCDPCLKILPRISGFYKKHPNLKIISVAFELEEKSIYKIPNFVKEYEMNWPQVYELMQMPKGFLTFEFNVKKFPTTILVDPYGVIIHRGGEESIDSLEEKLDKLLSSVNR